MLVVAEEDVQMECGIVEHIGVGGVGMVPTCAVTGLLAFNVIWVVC